MTYVLYGATLAAAWFAVLNAALSLIVCVAAGPVTRARRAAPERRGRVLLALRLLPAVLSIAFAAGVFLPSFWRLEPRDFDEAFGVTTTALAAFASAMLAAAAARGLAAGRDAARRTRGWLEHARPIALEGTAVPAFCIDAAAPAMMLVGVVRPKLLLTRPVLDLLTPEELRAAVDHEIAHLGAWDNVKRLAMRATPDALSLVQASRRIERAWALAAEHAADTRVARDARAGLALAAALVKVARLTPADLPAVVIASPLVSGESIAARVQRLLEPTPPRPGRRVARAMAWAGAASAAAALATGYAPLLHAVHGISEVLVHALP